MEDMMWQTRDGRWLRIEAMETSHVMNCIRKIELSRKGWRREYLERLKLEIEIRNIQNRRAG